MAGKHEKGLPCNVEAEKMVLGSILLDGSLFPQAKAILEAGDFSLEKHRRIYRRIGQIYDDGGHIDRITVINQLMMFGELESVDGSTYVISLDEGMPLLPNIESYAWIVKEKSSLRSTIFAAQHLINRAMMGDETARDIIDGAEESIQRIDAGLASKQTLLSPAQIIESHGGIPSFLQHAIKPGISTGFPQIDEYTLGLQEGCHYIIGGRTGSGKSALAENIGINVAKAGTPVAIFSLEMSKELLIARAVCAEAKVPFKAYIKNDMDPEQRHAVRDALNLIMELPLFIDDSPDLTVSQLPSRVDRAVRDKHIGLFITDYLQIMNAEPELKLFAEYDRVTFASKICRGSARKHNIRSIALSQLSRPADKRKPGAKPTLSDLKSSGGIENDAAAAILIHRPEMFDHNNQSLKFKAQAIIAKSRVGGQGDVNLRFDGKFYKFTDEGPTEDHYDEDD